MTALARHHQIHGLQPVLPVPDVRAAADWFMRVLGLEIDFLVADPGEPPYYGRVRCGDGSWGAPVFIHLQQDDGRIEPSGEIRLHVGHDVDGLFAHVVAAGAETLDAPADQPWGLREFSLRAPGGHVLVLGAEVASPSEGKTSGGG
jgi:uncharacterized glyoxalase superfamily protein PhnB